MNPADSPATPIPSATPSAPAAVSANDFKRIDLRTAKIVDVREHPNADRLWVLMLDIGEGKTKEIVAGVRSHHSKESLLNRTIILVNNLEPAAIRGVTSNGMMLAARHGDVLALLTTDPTVPPGTKIS